MSVLSDGDRVIIESDRSGITRGNSFYDGTLDAKPEVISQVASQPLGDVFDFEEHGAWDNFLQQYKLQSVRHKFVGRSPLDYLMSLIPSSLEMKGSSSSDSTSDDESWNLYNEVCTEAGLTRMEKAALKQALIEYSSAKQKRIRESVVHSRSFLSERAIHVLHPSVFEHNFTSDQKVTFSFAVAGGGLAGKTSLIRRLHSDVFDPAYRETHSLDVQTLYVAVNPERVDIPVAKVHLWDYGGQDEYRRQIPPQFIRGKHAVLFVYDILRLDSLKEIQEWYSSMSNIVHMDDLTCVLVGSKSDLLYECDHFTEEDADKVRRSAKKLSDSLGMTLFQVSSKSGQNIVPMIVETVKLVLLKNRGIDCFNTGSIISGDTRIGDDCVRMGTFDRRSSSSKVSLELSRKKKTKADCC